jgi:hypothetical protein
MDNHPDEWDVWEVVLKGYGRRPDRTLARGTREGCLETLRGQVQYHGAAVVLRRYTATS